MRLPMPLMMRRAFTLIELLVVVAIIVVLISILLPSLGRAREQAKAVVCGNNQRQIGIAINLYTTENNSILPYSTTNDVPGAGSVWVVNSPNYPTWIREYTVKLGSAMADYRGTRITICPSYKAMWSGSGNYGLNYHLFRTVISGSAWSPWRKLTQIPNPGGALFVVDNQYEGTNALSADQYLVGANMTNVVHLRHNGYANVLWGDYHVEPYKGTLPTSSSGLTGSRIWRGGMD